MLSGVFFLKKRIFCIYGLGSTRVNNLLHVVCVIHRLKTYINMIYYIENCMILKLALLSHTNQIMWGKVYKLS